MPIESKEVLEYLNIEGVDKVEDFKAKFESTYINRNAIKEDKELLGTLFGKTANAARTAIVRELKREGIEFEEGEVKKFKDNSIEMEEFFTQGINKVKSFYQNQLEEVKKNSGKPSEELEKAWNEKLAKKEGEVRDLKALLDASKKEWEHKETEFNGQLKNIKLDTRKADLERDFKWSTEADELKKEGFKSVMSKKYKLDLDENGTLEIFNTKGERIPNPKKNGTFKTPLEVFEEEGLAAKVWAANPVAGKAAPRPAMQHIESPAFPTNGRVRTAHPAAVSAAEGRA